MNLKELVDEIYTGGDHIIGFVLMDDIRKFDLDNGVTRYCIRGFPTDYVVRCSNVLTVFANNETSQRLWTNQTSFNKHDDVESTLGSESCPVELPNDVNFGYNLDSIKAALSIFTSMNIQENRVTFHFPDIDAPLVLTISEISHRRSGPEWGILICSCDVIQGEFA
jgi:hypothetical protein